MSYKHIVFDHDGTLVKVGLTETILFDEIKELIVQLKQRGSKLYVWTARNRHSTLESLKSHDILSLFEDISTPNDAQMKPSCAGLELMLEGVDKTSVCVIGDNSSDVLGAKAFGVIAIGANWNDGSSEKYDYLKSCGADHVFNKISELKEIL